MRWRDHTVCPADDDLIRLAAGDLSPRHTARLQGHLRTCQECAKRSQAWLATVDAYGVEADESATRIPEQPRWLGFRRALLAEDESWRRRQTVARRWRSSAAAIAATLILCVGWYLQTEVRLDAEEVLSRAAAHEAAHDGRLVAIRHSPSTETSVSGRASSRGSVQPSASEPFVARSLTADELGRRLAEYGFDVNRPLSVRPFQSWRRSARSPNDRLVFVGDDLLKLATSTPDGIVREAEIVVQTSTYEPVALSWRFSDGFSVALSVMPEDSPAVTTPRAAEVAPKRVTPTPDVGSHKFDELEIEVRTALYRLGTPIGRDVTVQRTGTKLRLEGAVSTSQQSDKIAAYARSRDYLDARVRAGAGSHVPELHASPSIDQWLAEAFPASDIRATFVPRLWTVCDDLDAAAVALDHLGRRYTTDASVSLGPDARRQLQELAQAHYRDLTTRYEDLERQVAALIGTVSRPVLPDSIPADWRERTPGIVTDIDRLTADLALVLTTPRFHTSGELLESAQSTLRPTLESLALRLAQAP